MIGNVGRLAAQKNQKYLLEILDNLLKKGKNVVLMIVGGGELERDLKEQVNKMGLSEYVHFTGMVKNANEYYSAMDVFVMPSLYEGLPFTAVEAQVNGLKCVMSDTITTMANISGEVEFLSLDASVEQWTEAVYRQAQCRSDEDIQRKVLENYDLDREAIKLENYYRKLANIKE